MDRRYFIGSMLAATSVVIATTAAESQTPAVTIYDQLRSLDIAAADAPAAGAIEVRGRGGRGFGRGGFRGGFRRRGFGRPAFGRCRLVVNRWGRLVRRCFPF